VFGDSASQELELAVYVDDEISSAHDAALQEADASTRLEMTIAPLPFVPQPRFGVNAATGAEQSDVLSIEHHDHLLHALLHAKQRLLIASQGASEDVVTDGFCRYLKERARSGAEVTIVLNDEAQVDRNAAERLRKLSQATSNVTVAYADLAGTSYLIHDDAVIETTFDWLSGGRNRREYSWHAGRLSHSSTYVDGVSARLQEQSTR
jgi:phosphatidylserine/phosphatidylglycerophosphate/cardiolipin synthase-like enzyme